MKTVETFTLTLWTALGAAFVGLLIALLPNVYSGDASAKCGALGLRGCLETAMGGLNPDNSMESERSPIPGAFDVDPRDPGRA